MTNKTHRMFNNQEEFRAAVKKMDEEFSKLMKKKKFESFKIKSKYK